MRYEAVKVNEIFNVWNEEAVLDSHVLNVLLQAVTYMWAKQAFFNAESIARPRLVIRVNICLHL